MFDVQKIYENAAFTYASELQMFIGLNMKRTSKAKGANKKVGRNPETGAGTLRLITGKLYRSFEPKKVSNGNIFQVQKNDVSFTLTYGSSVPYAAIHEYGGTAGRGAKIPSRPYIAPAVAEWQKENLPDFGQKIKLEIIAEIKKWLANQKQSKA